MKHFFYFLLFILLGSQTFKKNPKEEIRDDFKKYYDQHNVEGSFVLFNEKNNKFIFAEFKL